ncbi:MAG: hemerythrin domain-containing protein [Proteobacteria bacterium]|nr:hemerythrin domain-containing protein [Pseudomonadota bacterium]
MEHVLHRVDPVHKQSLHGLTALEGLSPMDPPDAYAPPSITPVAVADMHPFLQRMMQEHVPFLAEVDAFEDTLLAIQKNGYTRAADGQLRHFLNFFDAEFIAHHRREEAALFPLLKKRLLAAGEHGSGDDPQTPVDVMQDEHIKAIQLAAVILNFLGLAFRFPDQQTRLIVLDAALEQAKFLVELLRLHGFREDQVVFPLAPQLITPTEFEQM